MARPSDHSPVVVEITDHGVHLCGVLDFRTVPALEHALDKLLKDRHQLSIDLSGISRADSAGLALMIEWLILADRYDTRLSLVNLPTQMQNISRVSNLEGILPLQFTT